MLVLLQPMRAAAWRCNVCGTSGLHSCGLVQPVCLHRFETGRKLR